MGYDFGAKDFDPHTGCRPNWQVITDGDVKNPVPKLAYLLIECGSCHGTGQTDTGGVTPEDQPIFDCCWFCGGWGKVLDIDTATPRNVGVYLARLPADWNEDSSLETWFPFTAKELDNWRTWGIVEIAVRNPNVESYMREWETRALKAEKELAALHASFARSIEARSKGL
jgi:hypothetical protein